jgi:ABC-type nitrate/sulfonate/bicarbonate transport system substrate-binding protein
MQKITLALDWTPNINHIGFFVAHNKGFYEEAHLEVEIQEPGSDDYQLTPAKKVELGQADVALCPTESVISYRTKENPFGLIAIAALLQEDLSAIAASKQAGIRTPRDLDGKTYSSYQARYEDGIVREMIKNDGGSGELKIIYPKKLGIWNTLLQGEADATWIFMNWEGVEAKTSGHALNYFRLCDYGIPYSYSPVITADASKVRDNLETYQTFLRATKKGYLYCHSHPREALRILKAELPPTDKDIDLELALRETSRHFGNEQTWGHIDPDNLSSFLDWIKHKELETAEIDTEDIYTKDCLP